MPPAKPPSINLLGQEDLAHSPQGRIVNWALTYGRYIMIGTEIVVLLAFISRFSLDRKLTDLREEIDQKQAILTANVSLENEIRSLQTQLANIKTLLTDQAKPVEYLALVASLLPADVYVNSLEITKDKIIADATAATTDGFNQLLINLQTTKKFTNVEIGDVKKNPQTGLELKFTALLPGTKKSK